MFNCAFNDTEIARLVNGEMPMRAYPLGAGSNEEP